MEVNGILAKIQEEGKGVMIVETVSTYATVPSAPPKAVLEGSVW